MAGLILGPIAWIMGKGDLKAMDEGRMDPEGRNNTNTGKICGMIATILYGSIVGLTLFGFLCCMGLGFLGVMGTANQTFTSFPKTTEFPEGSAGAAARDFCNDLYLDRPEDAYGQLTRARQDALPLQQFRNDLDSRPAIKNSASFNVTRSAQGNNTFDAEFSFVNQREKITVMMVREDGGWKVDQVIYQD